jgi:hypothetical protein
MNMVKLSVWGICVVVVLLNVRFELKLRTKKVVTV